MTIYDGFFSGGDHGELSTFVYLMDLLLGQEGLQRIFDGKETFTLFAPTNAAFNELIATMSEEELAEMLDINSDALSKLLGFHFSRGVWNRPTGAITMMDNNVAHTYRKGSYFKIEQATVLDQARFRNGIVATVDNVIFSNVEGLALIFLLNCDTKKHFFEMYNGGDIFCVIPRHIAGVDANGGKNSKKCNDKKRGCQVRLTDDHSGGSCIKFAYAHNGDTVVKRKYMQLTVARAGSFPSCNR